MEAAFVGVAICFADTQRRAAFRFAQYAAPIAAQGETSPDKYVNIIVVIITTFTYNYDLILRLSDVCLASLVCGRSR